MRKPRRRPNESKVNLRRILARHRKLHELRQLLAQVHREMALYIQYGGAS